MPIAPHEPTAAAVVSRFGDSDGVGTARAPAHPARSPRGDAPRAPHDGSAPPEGHSLRRLATVAARLRRRAQAPELEELPAFRPSLTWWGSEHARRRGLLRHAHLRSSAPRRDRPLPASRDDRCLDRQRRRSAPAARARAASGAAPRVYATASGELWTEAVTLERDPGELLATLHLGKKPPKQAGSAEADQRAPRPELAEAPFPRVWLAVPGERLMPAADLAHKALALLTHARVVTLVRAGLILVLGLIAARLASRAIGRLLARNQDVQQVAAPASGDRLGAVRRRAGVGAAGARLQAGRAARRGWRRYGRHRLRLADLAFQPDQRLLPVRRAALQRRRLDRDRGRRRRGTRGRSHRHEDPHLRQPLRAHPQRGDVQDEGGQLDALPDPPLRSRQCRSPTTRIWIGCASYSSASASGTSCRSRNRHRCASCSASTDSSVQMQLSVWSETTTWFSMKTSLCLEIKRALDEHGVRRPYPHRVIEGDASGPA